MGKSKDISRRKGIIEQMEEANVKYYYDLPSTIEEFTKIVEDLIGEASNEGFNNTRK